MAAQRVAVVGATGNIGTSVLHALAADPAVGEILGVARRAPDLTVPKTEFVEADVARSDLRPLFRGVDTVVHLAWLFQPTRSPEITWEANVIGSTRVFEAAADAGVSTIVYTSSVGAYSPGDGDRRVAEDWPTHGWPGAAYTREKAYVERYLDGFEGEHRDVRVVRVRPGFVFKREAATEQRRLFAGPFVPGKLVRPSLIPVLPDIPGLRIQAVHSEDLGDAIRACVVRDVSGAFNVATEPIVNMRFLADLLGARLVKVPAVLVRQAVSAGWLLHLVPATPGLFDAVLRLPLMDTARARSELDWRPKRWADDALGEFLTGLREGAGTGTAPLAPDEHRAHELGTGIGQRP